MRGNAFDLLHAQAALPKNGKMSRPAAGGSGRSDVVKVEFTVDIHKHAILNCQLQLRREFAIAVEDGPVLEALFELLKRPQIAIKWS